MKIQIEKKDLMNLIGKTQNIVEKKNTMPILVNVLLDAQGSSVKVFATDLEVSLTDETKVQILEPGKVAVSAKSLFEIAKELSEGMIQLHKKENNWLEIKQGKYTSKIVGVSAEEYPIFPTYQGQDFIKIETSVLRDMIEKTIYSISTDETRYHLNGVYFERSVGSVPNQFRMVATDGHRLSLIDKTIQQNNPPTSPQGVIIPRKGLNEIRKLLDTLSGEFEMAIEGSQLIVKQGSTILMIRLIEGRYPNYQQFIPQNLKHKIIVSKDSFLTSLKRVSLLANQKSKGVTILLTNGKMEISSNNPELGDAKEEIECGFEGNEIKVGFNAKYITDVLSSMNDDKIEFHLNDQLSPGIMRPHNDSTYTCVVMPMRI